MPNVLPARVLPGMAGTGTALQVVTALLEELELCLEFSSKQLSCKLCFNNVLLGRKISINTVSQLFLYICAYSQSESHAFQTIINSEALSLPISKHDLNSFFAQRKQSPQAFLAPSHPSQSLPGRLLLLWNRLSQACVRALGLLSTDSPPSAVPADSSSPSLPKHHCSPISCRLLGLE